jgi:hypothetical protein
MLGALLAAMLNSIDRRCEQHGSPMTLLIMPTMPTSPALMVA